MKALIRNSTYTQLKKFGKDLCHALCLLLLALALWNCDAKNPLAPSAFSFSELKVGQEWHYLKWEKFYDETRKLTGDTLTLAVIAKAGKLITFAETLHGRSSSDTTIFQMQFEDSFARQVGNNDSKLFRFLNSHEGILWLTPIDSNRVRIAVDSSLFGLREQTGKNHFLGQAERAQLHLNRYENLTVYYDERLTYVDGPGHVALFSPQEGLVAMINFGGFSLVAQAGYELFKP